MTPGPDKPGIPKMYYDLADPFVALAMAAQTTRSLKLGTSICLVVQRDPIWLAKSVASLDALSGGRFLFGVGAGWNQAEMADHGTRWEGRIALMRERLAAMREIWTRDVAEFHGKHVDFGPMYAWPKPRQKPHPPIVVAANAPRGLARAVEHDGWMPILDAQGGGVFEHLPALRERLAKAGKDPARFEITLYMCPQDRALVEALPRRRPTPRGVPAAARAARRRAEGTRCLRGVDAIEDCVRRARCPGGSDVLLAPASLPSRG